LREGGREGKREGGKEGGREGQMGGCCLGSRDNFEARRAGGLEGGREGRHMHSPFVATTSPSAPAVAAAAPPAAAPLVLTAEALSLEESHRRAMCMVSPAKPYREGGREEMFIKERRRRGEGREGGREGGRDGGREGGAGTKQSIPSL